MNLIIYAIPVFMLIIAIECACAYYLKGNAIAGANGQMRQIYSFGDSASSIMIGILSRIATAFPRILTVGIYIAVYDAFATTTWDVKNPWSWVVALVIYDFLYYWKHRANHEVRIMWAGHITHHNSEYFNLSTALRQASTTFVFDWIFYLPMALLGVPWQIFVIVALIDLLYQFWVHTELVGRMSGRMAWFEHVFVSPSNHRVHHGQDDYCIDKNYGGILVVWDKLFGTFQLERVDANGKSVPISYGVRTALQSYNPVWGNWHYYAIIWQDFKRARGLAAKLDTLFAPPSGWTGEALEQFDASAFTRYAVPASAGVGVGVRNYVMVQLLLNIVAVCGFLYLFPKITALPAGLLAAWLTAAMLAPLALLEGRR